MPLRMYPPPAISTQIIPVDDSGRRFSQDSRLDVIRSVSGFEANMAELEVLRAQNSRLVDLVVRLQTELERYGHVLSPVTASAIPISRSASPVDVHPESNRERVTTTSLTPGAYSQYIGGPNKPTSTSQNKSSAGSSSSTVNIEPSRDPSSQGRGLIPSISPILLAPSASPNASLFTSALSDVVTLYEDDGDGLTTIYRTGTTDQRIRVDLGLLGRLPAGLRITAHEDPCAVFAIDDGADRVEWRFAKEYSQLRRFDHSLRALLNRWSKEKHAVLPVTLANFPDKSLFSTSNLMPSKVDQRIDMLNAYFATVVATLAMSRPDPELRRSLQHCLAALTQHNIVHVPPHDSPPHGFLMQRMRYGAWRVRWCILNAGDLDIYDQPNGTLVESLDIRGARVYVDTNVRFDASEDDERYAFVIVTRKTRVEHRLSAETPEKRGKWLEVLHAAVIVTQFSQSRPFVLPFTLVKSQKSAKPSPYLGFHSGSVTHLSPSPPRHLDPHRSYDHGTTTHTAALQVSSELSLTPRLSPRSYRSAQLLKGRPTHMFGPGPTFGVTLSRVAHNAVRNGLTIPRVVARCMDLLVLKNAVAEEGLFRVPGANSLVDDLEAEFETWGDFDLIAADIDVHSAVALLKRFLRMIPKPLMGEWSETQAHRCAVLDDAERIRVLAYEILQLNQPERSLLHVFMGYLQQVARNEKRNRMNSKNLGIVLSPTVRLPGALIAVCIDNFNAVFNVPEKALPPRPLPAY